MTTFFLMPDFQDKSRLALETDFFSAYVSEHKRQLFRELLDYRTRFFTVVLEDLYQPQNASAVLRSCDGFGIQDIHIIENRNFFDIDKGVTIGSDKWLNLYRYNKPDSNNTVEAYRQLREKGYQIVATTPHKQQVSLPDFFPQKPAALVFGAEKMGLTNDAIDQADAWLHLPMYGFSESFNISVCVALCLYHLRGHMDSSDIPWQLTNDQKDEIYLQWLRKSIRKLPALERKLTEMLER